MVYFFFFKQKTAYEMRISDWSSDVCSSDLLVVGQQADEDDEGGADPESRIGVERLGMLHQPRSFRAASTAARASPGEAWTPAIRSEERRVGKECVGTCRSRLSLYQ